MSWATWRVSWQFSCYNTIYFTVIRVLHICFLFSDLSAELPFVLMHPKPEEEELPPLPKSPSQNHLEGGEVPTENLIQLDT